MLDAADMPRVVSLSLVEYGLVRTYRSVKEGNKHIVVQRQENGTVLLYESPEVPGAPKVLLKPEKEWVLTAAEAAHIGRLLLEASEPPLIFSVPADKAEVVA